MRASARHLFVLVVAACVGAHASADAQPESHAGRGRGVNLRWVRTNDADACVASAPLAREIEARLGRTVFVPTSEAAFTVEGRVHRDAGVFRAVIVITDASGRILEERMLDSAEAHCDPLDELVVIAVASMIDPLTVPPIVPTGPTIAVPIERVDAPVSVETESHPRLPYRIEVDARVVGAIGLLPIGVVGFEGALVVRPPRFVLVSFEYAFFPSPRFLLDAGGTVRFIVAYGGPAICPLSKRFGPVELRGCVGIDAGFVVLRGDTESLDDPSRLIGQARTSMRLHWDVSSRITLHAGLQMGVPFRHRAFTADHGATLLFAPGPVFGVLDLGVGVRFP